MAGEVVRGGGATQRAAPSLLTAVASTGLEAPAVPLRCELPVLLGEPSAEAAVLGCVLRGSTEQARALLGLLSDQDWSVPAHARVAQAAAALLEQGLPVDPVTVLGQLRRQGSENACNASRDTGVMLIELCQAAPSLTSAPHYLRIVLEHAYRRRAQQAAVRLAQAAETGSLPALVDLVEEEHAALTSHLGRLGTQSV